MPRFRISLPLALALSLVLHAGVLGPWALIQAVPTAPQHLQVRLVDKPVEVRTQPIPIEPPPRKSLEHPAKPRPEPILAAPTTAGKRPASLAAPPPPSAEEWQLASTYTLKNSKRYRNNWGQLVRSKMGTAVEGPDQGQVRFRIEIAPDGTIAKVEELWSTSEPASRLAWEAIRALPPLPPTPTGKPLVFEQTISFLPYETGWPPSYKLDCLPDPPTFQNPFAWDGASPRKAMQETAEDTPPSGSPQADCVTDSTSDSIEEEEVELKRQMEQWRWGR